MVLDNDYYDGFYDEDVDFTTFDSVDMFDEATEYDAADLLAGIESSYCETMLAQCKDEFATYMNEGSLEAMNEGFVEKAKYFIKRVWDKIKMYFRKFMNMLSRVFGNVYKFYKKHTAEINAGCNGVTEFKGYKGLKSFGRISGVATLVTASAAITRHYTDEIRAITDTRLIGEVIAKATSDVCKKIAGYIEPSKFDWALNIALRASESKETISYTPAEIANVLGSETASTCAANQLKSIEACLRDASNTAAVANESGSGVFKLIKKIISVQTRAITKCSKAVKDVVAQANSYAHAAVSVSIGDAYHAGASNKEKLMNAAKGAAARGINAAMGEGYDMYDGYDDAFTESDEAYDYMADIGIID